MSSVQRNVYWVMGLTVFVVAAAVLAAGPQRPGDGDAREKTGGAFELPVGPGVKKGLEERMQFPGEAAYRAELEKAEKAYIERVLTARMQYVADIKNFEMRASTMRETAEKLDAEKKRVIGLARPIAIPEPSKKTDAAPGDKRPADDAAASQRVTVSLTAPSGLWSIAIQEVRLVGDELWVLSKLTQSPGMGTMALKEVTDSATVPAKAKRVRHFVLGKTWNWGDAPAGMKFIKNEAELGAKWKVAKPLKIKR